MVCFCATDQVDRSLWRKKIFDGPGGPPKLSDHAVQQVPPFISPSCSIFSLTLSTFASPPLQPFLHSMPIFGKLSDHAVQPLPQSLLFYLLSNPFYTFYRLRLCLCLCLWLWLCLCLRPCLSRSLTHSLTHSLNLHVLSLLLPLTVAQPCYSLPLFHPHTPSLHSS